MELCTFSVSSVVAMPLPLVARDQMRERVDQFGAGIGFAFGAECWLGFGNGLRRFRPLGPLPWFRGFDQFDRSRPPEPARQQRSHEEQHDRQREQRAERERGEAIPYVGCRRWSPRVAVVDLEQERLTVGPWMCTSTSSSLPRERSKRLSGPDASLTLERTRSTRAPRSSSERSGVLRADQARLVGVDDRARRGSRS